MNNMMKMWTVKRGSKFQMRGTIFCLIGVINFLLNPQAACGGEIQVSDAPGIHEVEVWADFDNCASMFLARLSGSITEADAQASMANYPSDSRIRLAVESRGTVLLSSDIGKNNETKIVSRETKDGTTLFWKIGCKTVRYQRGEDGGEDEGMIEDTDVLKIVIDNMLPDMEKANVFFNAMVAHSEATGAVKGLGSGASSVAKFAATQRDAVERLTRLRESIQGRVSLSEAKIDELFDEASEILNSSSQAYDAMDSAARASFESATGDNISLKLAEETVNGMSGINMTKRAKSFANRVRQWNENGEEGENNPADAASMAGVYKTTSEYMRYRFDEDGKMYQGTTYDSAWKETGHTWKYEIVSSKKDGKDILIKRMRIIDGEGNTYNSYDMDENGVFRSGNSANPGFFK